MRKSLLCLTVLTLICTLCACNSTSVPFSSLDKTGNIETSTATDSSNPYSFIDETSTAIDTSNPFFFVDETTTKDDIIALYGTDEYGKCDYEEFELFGEIGDLDFKFKSDGSFVSVIFSFSYPGYKYWVCQGENDKYSPTTEDKHAAQEFLNNVVSQFTEAYGTPDCSESGVYSWDRSDDFITRNYTIETKKHSSASGTAFTIYYVIR